LTLGKDAVLSFIEDYMNSLKELTEKVITQFSIPQTFVDSSFPKYMTSKGIHARLIVSKNEMQIAMIIDKLLNGSTLDIDVDFVEKPIHELFALKHVTNIVPFFYVDEPFSRLERIILISEKRFDEYWKLLKAISYSTILKGIGINALVYLKKGGDVKLVDVCIDTGMLPYQTDDAIARMPFMWLISYPIERLRSNVAKYHALNEVSEYVSRLFAKPGSNVLGAVLHQFNNLVKEEKYEKPLHEFLCKYPWFIESGTIYAICNEYLGDCKPDIVLLLFNGIAIVVELEPSKVKLFTRQGSISSEFEKRLKQIRDYVMYYREHREVFDKLIEEGLIQRIPDISEIQGILIISSGLTPEELKELNKIRSIYEKEGIRILTYDELIMKISLALKYVSGEGFRSYNYVLLAPDIFEINRPITLRSFVSLIGGFAV